MSNYKIVLLLVVILSIAGFLRLYQITATPTGLYPDEAIGGNQGLEALRTGGFSATGGPASGWKLFYPENNGRSGLFINLQGLSAGLLGAAKPWTLRFPSAILGILTVLGLYFLAKELFSEGCEIRKGTNMRINTESNDESLSYIRKKFVFRSEAIALLSAFLLATSFWHINFSRIGFDGIMAPFFLVWAVYFLLKAFHSQNSTYHLLPTTYSIIAGLIYGLGFHSYTAYRVTPVLILFIILYYIKKHWNDAALRKKILLSAFCFLLFTFVAALPMGIYFLAHPGDFSNRTSQISVFASARPLADLSTNILKTLAMFNFAGDGNWRHNYSGRPELFLPVGILFIIGIGIGIMSLLATKYEKNTNIRISAVDRFRIFVKNSYFVAERNFGFLILFLWFALGAAPAVFSNDGVPHALRSILMTPPTFIFAAIGGIWFYEAISAKVRNGAKMRKIFLATCYLLLTTFAFEAYNTYFVLWAKNPNVYGAFSADYAELGGKLNALPTSVPKYVIVKAGGVPVNGIPMPAQTVMFITDTYSTESQKTKNIYYVLPEQENTIPSDGLKFYLN